MDHALWNNPNTGVIMAAISATQMLCGAVILLLLHLWLRQRDVKDRSLLWLCISLFSWALIHASKLLSGPWKISNADAISYTLSPVSSILFTMTAFQLARVRELFHNKDRKFWPRNMVACVVAASLIEWILLFVAPPAAKVIDATVSSLALIILGLGLIYSFYIYNNQYLAALTGLTFLYQIAKQFLLALQTSSPGARAILDSASSTVLTMLFIALAVAWGLSDTSRLRFVGGSSNVNVVAIFFDLRGSSQWAKQVTAKRSASQVGLFMDSLREWARNQALSFPDNRPDFIKFLGDGFLFVWEVPDRKRLWERAETEARLAYQIYSEYGVWLKTEDWEQELGSVPPALGIGVDAGHVIRITYENGANDYIGAAINNAAKLQDLARPNGGVVILSSMWQECGNNSDGLAQILQDKFAIRQLLSPLGKIGDDEKVYATSEVVFSVSSVV